MREMDLIPADYRRIRTSRQILIGFAVVYAVVIITVFAGKLLLNARIKSVNHQITQLQEAHQTLESQQQVINDLQKERGDVEKKIAFVEMLQQGGNADKMFLIFDQVLDNTVWMQEWSYTAGNLADDENDQTPPMMILIRGQALDHTALSGFVKRLMAQSVVKDVHVRRSAITDQASGTVSFEMEIL